MIDLLKHKARPLDQVKLSPRDKAAKAMPACWALHVPTFT